MHLLLPFSSGVLSLFIDFCDCFCPSRVGGFSLLSLVEVPAKTIKSFQK
ncbi:hypothetical protein MANES_12G095201v8 [Manihot esculenta]|uniref:Uncharacterized protein n=1 Tax=Manihot esculenta TaxID=3983 RepID=A0ACB7GQ97_MANES|nr:hypothetical protein MANES_12G095201v8 [Manihot esculenta]